MAGIRIRRPDNLTWDDTLDYFLYSADENANGCLIPVIKPSPFGYVQFRFGDGLYMLHRAVLERRLGRRLRDGYDTSHLCHNKPCCNPDHLVEETRSENMARSAALGRLTRDARGERNNCSRLTDDNVMEIREMLDSGYSQSEIARAFGVARSTITCISTGRNWKHVA